MNFDVKVVDSLGAECTQQVTIVVAQGLNPSVWWTMEAGPGTGPKNDVIQSLGLIRTSGNNALWTVEPGIIGNSWQLRSVGIAGQSSSKAATNSSPFLNFTDAGITIAWWQNYSTNNLPNLTTGVRYGFTIGATPYIIQVYQWPANTKVFLDFVQILSDAPVSQSVWHFFALRYDHATNTITLDIDQTLQYTAIVAPTAVGAYSAAQLQIETDENNGGGALYVNTAFDEIAFFQEVLSDSDLDDIYNGGAGITWP